MTTDLDSLLVGLLLHLQLNGEDFRLSSCLTCSSCLRQGCELASLKHQFASRELTEHQPRWSLGLLLLTSLGGLNLLDLCNLLLGCYSLTCCSSLGWLLQDQGDPLCFTALESANTESKHRKHRDLLWYRVRLDCNTASRSQ